MPTGSRAEPPGPNSFGDYVGLKFTRWEEGYSQCTLDINDRLLNPYRGLHGGVAFTMADSGMGSALVATLEKGEQCATIEASIVYFRSVESGTLTCDTKVIHRSRKVATLESEITQGGQLVAKAIGTWSIFKRHAP